MPEIIILFFVCRSIGKLALRKGQKPLKWQLLTIVSFFIFEMIGMNLSLAWLGNPEVKNIEQSMALIQRNPGIILFNWFLAFGGYLLVRFILERKPDQSELNS